MKRVVSAVLAVGILSLSLAACGPAPKATNKPAGTQQAAPQQQAAPAANPVSVLQSPKNRTVDDYAKELKALTGATEVGEVINPENNKIRYPFIALKKDGNVIGYGSWVTVPIYQHTEDLIIAVKPDGTLLNFKAIDANEKHPKMNDDSWRNKFIGMSYDKVYDPKVDTNTGSTISSNMMTAELRNTLFVFKTYIAKEVNKK